MNIKKIRVLVLIVLAFIVLTGAMPAPFGSGGATKLLHMVNTWTAQQTFTGGAAMYAVRVEKTANATLTSPECMGTLITNRGSAEINLTLPAFTCSSTIRVVDEKAYKTELNPPAGEALELDGSLLSGVSVVRSPGVVGSKIVGTRMKSESGTTWFWSFDTVRGAYDGTGASD